MPRSSRRSKQGAGRWAQQKPIEDVREMPGKELSELQQCLSQTQFHECLDSSSEVVWGEWRPEIRVAPQECNAGDPGVGTEATQPDQWMDEAVGICTDLLDLLAFLMWGHGQLCTTSPAQLEALVDAAQQGVVLLKQLELAQQQSLRSSKVQFSSSLPAEVLLNQLENAQQQSHCSSEVQFSSSLPAEVLLKQLEHAQQQSHRPSEVQFSSSLPMGVVREASPHGVQFRE